MSLRNFLAGYDAGELEATRKVQTVGTDFSELMRKYERFLDKDSFSEDEGKQFVGCNRDITEILTPDEINSFLQATQQHESHRNYSWNTGSMVSRLIQNSYNKGYNNFLLNLKNDYFYTHDNIGIHLLGTEATPLFLTIQGDVEHWCGEDAKYSSFTLSGDVGDCCGDGAQYSSYVVKGNAKNCCGLNARNSTFTFNGTVGNLFGDGAIYCTFKTPLWGNIEKIKEVIDTKNGNIIIYIDQGKEVRIV